jgi:hypothetical protein
MDFIDFYFTRRDILRTIFTLYLEGLSIEEIMWKIDVIYDVCLDMKDINIYLDYVIDLNY